MIRRRELLEGLGIASASTLLWAFGCGGAQKPTDGPAIEDGGGGEVRTWLRDAVSRLVVAYPFVHVLAVTRRRTTAAFDVLGATVARGRRDGVVLVVRDRDGVWREQASSDLSRAGVTLAVRALIGISSAKAPPLTLPAPPKPTVSGKLTDEALRERAAAIAAMDPLDSRVIYAASSVDLEDATVWSISPTHDREQRLVRIHERVARVAYNGPRPVAGEAGRAWTGSFADDGLGVGAVRRATQLALELMTPGTVEDGERTVLLDPSVVASLVDAGARALLTSAAARRPEIKRALVAGAPVAAPLFTLVDDPTVRGAYGGFAFDDEGEPAAPITLVDAGKLAGTLADRAGGGKGRGRRPGHVGAVEPAPSHLRLAPGTDVHDKLREDGFILEGGGTAIVDPSSSRVVIGAARAREIKGGKETGRVYPDVELVGDLVALLAAATGVSSDTATFGYRDELDDEPRWRSIEVPWLRTRGLVRARRRA